MNTQQAIQALKNTPARPGSLTPKTFAQEGERSAATTSSRTRIAKLKAKAPLMVRGEERFELTVPAYESFTTDGTAGNTETFTLSHDLIQTPNTENIVVWEGGTYVGNEAALGAVDYTNNTFDYTDDGTSNTLHVWYVTSNSAEFEVQKVSSNGNVNQSLYAENLRLIHRTNLSEQPEDPDVEKTPLNPAIATDMEVEVYIDAPFTFRWTDPNGDGAEPTNLVFSFPVNHAKRQVPGLADAVSTDMSAE